MWVEVNKAKPSKNRMKSEGKSMQSHAATLVRQVSRRQHSVRTEDRGEGDTSLSQKQTAYPLL